MSTYDIVTYITMYDTISWSSMYGSIVMKKYILAGTELEIYVYDESISISEDDRRESIHRNIFLT